MCCEFSHLNDVRLKVPGNFFEMNELLAHVCALDSTALAQVGKIASKLSELQRRI